MNNSLVIIECPHCHARYRVDASKAGRDVVTIRCPKCARAFPAPVASAPQPQASSPAECLTQQRKILIVDDAKFFREVLVDLLKPLDIPCLTASTPEEAWRLLRRERPTVLLVDLNLPGKSGYDLIREIRADRESSMVKILAMSGVFREEADVAAVLAAGADDFISKSFKPEQLQLRLAKLLAAASS